MLSKSPYKGIERRRHDDSCPMTPDCVERLLDEIDEMKKKVDELHKNLIKAHGFVAGMRLGAGSVFLLIGAFLFMVWGLLSGRVSLKELFSILF